jgi:hypothetical protein
MYPAVRFIFAVSAILAALLTVSLVFAPPPPADVRLTHDDGGNGGYISSYTIGTNNAYTDPVLQECSISLGRQNEPSVAVDPRDTNVLIGSSNDYCGVFVGKDANGNPIATGPIWLGYYRSEDSGHSFISSLVPGYPGDTSLFAQLAHIRTASAGDPVIAWDNHGRVFMGSESSGDPDGSPKGFGDVWVARYVNPGGPDAINTLNDGKLYQGTETVAAGSSSPTTGKFHDKTSIEVDRTGGTYDGYVYFAWARFTGGATNGFNASVYFVRSTDHGVTWSDPQKLSQTVHDIQFPDIAVTGNGHVYITFRQFQSQLAQIDKDAVMYVKSTDGGKTFSAPKQITTFEPYDPTDISVSGDRVGECGDFDLACQSGYTFPRGGTQIRSTADQTDTTHEWVYIVYDPSKPGTEVPTGTSFGTIVSEDLPLKYHQKMGSQSGIYFIRLDGADGSSTEPKLIDSQTVGQQFFPDISADQGSLHVMWWDSRNDTCYSPMRPVANCANKTTHAGLDVYATVSNDHGDTFVSATRVTDVSSNPTFEQFSNRTDPFAGDYLYITSRGSFSYAVWTDWRNTVQGTDPRESPEDADAFTSDVMQCRTCDPSTGTCSSDTCPHAGGLDQNIYGDFTP